MRRAATCATILAGVCLGGNAHAQSTRAGRIDITQVDISKFPEVTVFFKVLGPDGLRLPEVRREMIELREGGQPAAITGFRGYGRFETRSILLVDVSGSMSAAVPGGSTKLGAARDACVAFLDACRSDDRVGLIAFDTTVRTISPLGEDPARVRNGATGLAPGGGTAWRDAVLAALDVLAAHNGRRTVLLLTDGQDNSSRSALSAVTARANALQIPIHVIALGTDADVDSRELKGLADGTGGQFLLMPQAERLAGLYQSMGRSVQDEVSLTYRSTRPSPDGTRRSLEIVIGEIRQSTQYLERHLLNITSDPGVFAMLFAMIGLAYIIPACGDIRRRSIERLARAEAFLPAPAAVGAAPPVLALTASIHPLAIPVDSVPRMVTIQLDATAELPPGVPPRLQPLSVLALLDLSASMDGERLQAARTALTTLVAGLGDHDSFGLIGFSDDAQLVIPPSRVGRLRRSLGRRLRSLHTGVNTRLAPALKLLLDQLPTSDQLAGRRLRVIIISDGRVEDVAQSQQTRAGFAPDVVFTAFGIGVDYDHEFLAQVCGKHRVVHLETAQEATHAFERFLRVDGHAITARTALRFHLGPGVAIHGATIVRGALRLALVGDEAAIDDIIPGEPTAVLVEMLLTPTVAGQVLLADVSLLCDLPGYRLSDRSASRRIEVEVTADPARMGMPNPGVVGTVKLVQTARIVESVEQDIRRGDVRDATRKLRATTRRLQQDGEHEKAQALEALAVQIEGEADQDKNIKQIWRATRRLSEGP